MKKSSKFSLVEKAIYALTNSRNDTNKRLVEQNLILSRNDNTVSLINKKTGKIQNFIIEFLEKGKGELFNKAFNLLAEIFSSEELGPKKDLATQMDGLRYDYPVANGVVFTLSRISDRKVISVLVGSLIPLQDEQGKSNGKSIFMVFYIASRLKFREYGFGRELLISAYQYAEMKADSLKIQFIGSAGECTYTSRKFWENVGLRRLYLQEKEAKNNRWTEICYVQPPLSFDLETGELEEGSGDAPEHFMAKLFDTKDQSPGELGKLLVSIIAGFYKTNNYINSRAFTSEQAYKKHLEAINPHLKKWKVQLHGKMICFFNQDEIKNNKLIIRDYITGEEEAKFLKRGYR